MMKKRLFSLILMCAVILAGFNSVTFAQETKSVPETESLEEAESVPETESLEETESVPETESLEEAESLTETESTEEMQNTTEASGNGEAAEHGSITGFVEKNFDAVDIYFNDYVTNGGETYLSSMLPDSVTAVYENGEKAAVDAVWIADRPFGAEGAGIYTYTLDAGQYDITSDFDMARLPKAVLNAVYEKKAVSSAFFAKRAVVGGIYDEQRAEFRYAGGAEPSDYGGYMTQYFNIGFDGRTYTGMCGKASYRAPAEGNYYVHEIPGGTRESDIVKAILLTNPLTGPYPDDTWKTIAGGKFNDKMLWSVHSALSVYWSDDEFGSDWIRVNAIAQMGNYLYDEWIPAHKSIMNSTHAYYLCASSKPHNSDNFGGKCPSGRQDVLFLSDEVTPQNGRVKLKKVSENPELSSGNSCYSLSGAVYGVYTDAQCKNSVGTLTTNENGISNTLELSEGTYYVKETKAPDGFLMNTQIYTVHLKAEETTEVRASDMPGSDGLGLKLIKLDGGGHKDAVLSGAQFTVKYYDGYYTKDNLPSRSDRTWVLETKAVTEQGKIVYKACLEDKYKVSGGSFYTYGGKAVLPLGTVTIEETKAPEGYVLEGGYLKPSGSENKVYGKYVAQIKNKGGTVRLEGGNVYEGVNFGTNMRINKIDAKTGKGLAGARLRVTDHEGKVVDEWTSDGNARTIKSLVAGQSYTMTEVSVPDGYATAKPVKFTVKNTTETQNVEMVDLPTMKQINKVDAKSGEGLPGAKLRITDEAGKVIDEWVSDGKPHPIEKLIVGKTYTLTEVGLPDGYVTAEPVKFTVKDTGEVQKVVMKNEPSVIQIDKVDEEGKALAGAVLRIIDKNNKRVDEWTSDGKGHTVKKLIVGETYTLKEVKAPEGYVTAEPVQFTVKDTKEIQKITMVNKCTRVEIIKVDAESGNMLSGASLEVHPKEKEDEIVDTWVTDITPHEILRLTAGTSYTIQENEAPDGYKIAEPVTFTVEDTDKVQKVTMSDEREDIPKETPTESETPKKPEVPKTGDVFNPLFWGSTLVFSGAASALFLIIKLKKKK